MFTNDCSRIVARIVSRIVNKTNPFKAKDLIKSFKDPVVKEIKDSGHTLMAESPNKVLDYLIEIL